MVRMVVLWEKGRWQNSALHLKFATQTLHSLTGRATGPRLFSSDRSGRRAVTCEEAPSRRVSWDASCQSSLGNNVRLCIHIFNFHIYFLSRA